MDQIENWFFEITNFFNQIFTKIIPVNFRWTKKENQFLEKKEVHQCRWTYFGNFWHFFSWNKSWKELFWEAKINQSGSSMHHIPKFNLWPISNHKVYAFYARKKGWYLRYNDTILTQCLKIDQKSYCERSELRLVTNETIEFFF